MRLSVPHTLLPSSSSDWSAYSSSPSSHPYARYSSSTHHFSPATPAYSTNSSSPSSHLYATYSSATQHLPPATPVYATNSSATSQFTSESSPAYTTPSSASSSSSPQSFGYKHRHKIDRLSDIPGMSVHLREVKPLRKLSFQLDIVLLINKRFD